MSVNHGGGLVKKMAVTLVSSGISQHNKMKNTHHP